MGQSIRLQLAYLGVDYEDRFYCLGDQSNPQKAWKDVKFNQGLDFPNVPYFITTDGLKLTEGLAIHEFLADSYDPSLLGSTPEEKARIRMLAGVFSPIRWEITVKCVSSPTKKEVADAMFEKVDPFFKQLGEFKFIAGDSISWLDFFVYEGLELFNWISDGALYTRYPVVGAYAKTMQGLP